MPYEIGEAPEAFELNTFSGIGINNGSAYHIEDNTLQNKVIVLAFIRYNANLSSGDDTAGEWLASLRRIHNANISIQCVAVIYGHDDSVYSQVPNTRILQTISTYYSAALGRYLNISDFTQIPVLIDEHTSPGNIDFISKQYRDTGILADPGNQGFDAVPAASVPRECCFYILQPHIWPDPPNDGYHRITDKWHTESFTEPAYPLSLRHLQGRDPSSTTNQTGDPEVIDDYIIQRAENLISAASVIRTYPADSATVNTLSNIRVVFSRPMDIMADFALAGPAVSGTAAVGSISYNGQNEIENTAEVSFTGYSLVDDPASIDNAGLTVSGSISPDHVSTWTIDLICKPVLSLVDSDDAVTNSKPVLVRVDFNEPVSDISGAVGNSWCTSANAAVSMDSSSPTGISSHFILKIDPTDTAFTGVQEGDDITIVIPAGITTDAPGNPNEISNTLSFTYDIEAPALSLSLPSSVVQPVSGPFTVRLDFDEEVKWTSSIAAILHNTSTNCSIGNLEPVPPGAPGDYHQSYTATVTPGGSPIHIAVKADVAEDLAGNGNSAVTASSGLDVTYDPNPATSGERHIAVVVDVSGSMGSAVSVNSEPERPKIEFITDALTAFLDELSQSVALGELDATDLIRFYKYAENAAALTVDGMQWIQLDQLTQPRINELVTLLDTGGGTAMGDGLVMALADMAHTQSETQYGHARQIILFADGQRNRGVNITQNTGTGTVTLHSTPAIELGPTASWEIPIHSIGVMTAGQGSDSVWLNRMEDISTATGGTHHAMTDLTLWSQTNQALTDIVQEIYAGNTPQEVFSTTDSIPVGTFSRSYDFTLDRSHRSMLILVTWPGNEPVKMSLKKGNTRVPSSISPREGNRHVVEGYRFPIIKPMTHQPWPDVRHHYFPYMFVSAEGDWEITIIRKNHASSNEAPFYISVLGDGKGLDYSVRIPRQLYVSGLPITAALRFRTNGNLISGLFAGDMIVEKQQYSIGNILVEHSGQLPHPGVMVNKIGPDGNIDAHVKPVESDPLDSRLRLLKMNRHAWSLMRKTERLNIPSQKKTVPGRLKWQLTDTTDPGIYYLRFNIRGVDSKYGKFMRTVSRTVTVHPRIDALASGIKVEKDNKDRIEITFIPRSASGNYLGPGWGKTLYIDCRALKQGEVTDNLDGSYRVVLTLKPRSPGDTAIRIEMAGQLLIKGLLGKIPK